MKTHSHCVVVILVNDVVVALNSKLNKLIMFNLLV